MKGGIPIGIPPANVGSGIPIIGGIPGGTNDFICPLINALCCANNPARSTSLITPL